MLEVLTVETPSLGDRSYVAHDHTYAVVIDPQRDIDRVLERTQALHLTITHVLETHVHNDYLTGGFALAREVGADYCLNALDPVRFDRVGLTDGDVLRVGSFEVDVIATPGHTFTHLSYVVRADEPAGHAAAAGEPLTAVFSGGSLLHGSTGRPDLLGSQHTEELARLQHASARRIAQLVPATAQLCPTHGFGSFCSTWSAAGTGTRVGDQIGANSALLLDRDAFVAQTVAGLGAFPAYYRYMSPRNLAGPPAAPRAGPVIEDVELRRRLAAGEPVVDVRPGAEYAAAHLPGTVNVGADGSLATWVGWLLPYGERLTVIGSEPGQLAAARRELLRIGLDVVDTAAAAPVEWSSDGGATYPVAGFARLARRLAESDPPLVLDVRMADEVERYRVRGSLHVPLPELGDRLGELPRGREIWVHCASGYRAGIAASVLANAGRAVVLLDEELATAADAGVPTVG